MCPLFSLSFYCCLLPHRNTLEDQQKSECPASLATLCCLCMLAHRAACKLLCTPIGGVRTLWWPHEKLDIRRNHHWNGCNVRKNKETSTKKKTFGRIKRQDKLYVRICDMYFFQKQLITLEGYKHISIRQTCTIWTITFFPWSALSGTLPIWCTRHHFANSPPQCQSQENWFVYCLNIFLVSPIPSRLTGLGQNWLFCALKPPGICISHTVCQ